MVKKTILLMIKIMIALLPLIGIAVYAGNNLISFTDEEAPYYIWNRNYCNSPDEKPVTTIILGDSGANAAYMPEVLSDSTVNLALGGATSVENYYMMSDWLKNHSAPDHVFISIIDFHFIRDYCFYVRCLYSHRLNFLQDLEIIRTAQKYGETSFYRKNCYLDLLAYELYLPDKYITSLVNAGFNQRSYWNQYQYEWIGIHGGRYMAAGNTQNQYPGEEYTSFRIKPMFEDYYKRLIELCLDHGCQVHLVKLPLPDNTIFTQEYLSQFHDYYDSLQAEYPGITVDDWISNGYDNTCFADQYHLNTHGSLRFSLELKELYPEAFDNSCSESQIRAINDNISEEDLAEELFKWCCLGPYVMIIYDGSGNLEERFENEYRQEGFELKAITPDGSDLSDIYITGNIQEFSLTDQIYYNNGIIEILPGSSPDTDNIYQWYPFSVQGLDVVIIDTANKEIVAEKKFD